MIRSPVSASFTICRYRGSKTCSGRNTLGNSTTFGSGKMGRVPGSIGDFSQSSMYGSRLFVHVVHEDVAAERARGGEVGLAVADLGDLADEADEIVFSR